jgi:hypothetical protein
LILQRGSGVDEQLVDNIESLKETAMPRIDSSTAPRAEQVAVQAIEESLMALSGLELRTKDAGGTRYDAVDTIRTRVHNLAFQAEHADAQAQQARRSRDDARQDASDIRVVSRLVQQACRFFGMEFDYVDDIGARHYAIASDDFSGDLAVNADNADGRRPTLSFSYGSAGYKTVELPLSDRGLTADIVRQLAGVFGIRLSRNNTPRYLWEELFTENDEPEVPEFARAAARRLFGPDVVVRSMSEFPFGSPFGDLG